MFGLMRAHLLPNIEEYIDCHVDNDRIMGIVSLNINTTCREEYSLRDVERQPLNIVARIIYWLTAQNFWLKSRSLFEICIHWVSN